MTHTVKNPEEETCSQEDRRGGLQVIKYGRTRKSEAVVVQMKASALLETSASATFLVLSQLSTPSEGYAAMIQKERHR